MMSKAIQKPSFVFYTLHHKVNRTPYVVHIMNPEEQFKTTLVSMLHKKDIERVGCLLEHHKKIKGVYPNNQFDHNTLFRIKIEEDAPTQGLNEFTIQRWNQQDLMVYCVERSLDLMLIENLEVNGMIQVVEFEIPEEYIIERLNKTIL
jgi:hypothetical protein